MISEDKTALRNVGKVVLVGVALMLMLIIASMWLG